MTTNVYIDGFNFYYGAVRGTPFKWLDPNVLCARLIPGHAMNRIRYCTAKPKPLPYDPDVHIRHAVYLRALRTIPNLEIHRGQFVEREVVLPQFPLAYPQRTDPSIHPPLMAKVQKREEKRSDVNIAAYLLVDCYENDFDEAVVISGDSDLSEPIKVVTRRLKKNVTVINPQRSGTIRWELKAAATKVFHRINTVHLANSQFPSTLSDAKGTFSKPSSW